MLLNSISHPHGAFMMSFMFHCLSLFIPGLAAHPLHFHLWWWMVSLITLSPKFYLIVTKSLPLANAFVSFWFNGILFPQNSTVGKLLTKFILTLSHPINHPDVPLPLSFGTMPVGGECKDLTPPSKGSSTHHLPQGSSTSTFPRKVGACRTVASTCFIFFAF